MISSETWAYHNPVRIHFGRGCRGFLAEFLAGQRVLVVCSQRGRRQLESDPLLAKALSNTLRVVWVDAVEANPDLNRLQTLAMGLLDAQVDCVLAFGGGSVIDTAKVLALAISSAARHNTLLELLSAVVDLPSGVSIPLYALPTTAGTGSEVTPYATVWDRAERRKHSLAGPAVYPHMAFVDPELSDTVSYSSTLSTGLDAINQAAESIWNRNMTPVSEMFAHRALMLGMMALPRLLNDLANSSLRDVMAEVSMFAGLAISQTRTSVCHSISYPLTAHFGVPHGLACAFTMPAVLRRSLGADDGRFERLAKVLLTNEPGKSDTLIRYFNLFNQHLKVADRVRKMVGSLEEVIALREEMNTPGRVDNSLIQIDETILANIICESFSSQ
jgi:alcohol dehydrogenase